jgi:hypothetical protein
MANLILPVISLIAVGLIFVQLLKEYGYGWLKRGIV